jgi:peptide/nickel transport system substrate-binding protein
LRPRTLLPVVGFFLAALAGFSGNLAAEPRHGIAMHGNFALPPDFTHLPYVNPKAPKGGVLRQAVTGSFDSTHPFIIKGQAATAVGTLVFESLMGRNWAEPFSLYGLLARSIDVSDNASTITFKLRPEAKFSDGTPVTSSDVLFSLEVLREHGRPNYRSYYAKVTRADAPDAATVVYHQAGADRELPLILGLMPVLPRHAWQGKDFEATTLEPLIGSGPYVMGEIKPGERITYRRNSQYWGKDLAISRGLWNFDEVRFDYYRDNNATFEAFKKGLADIRIENDPSRWSTGYDFPAVKDGSVIREKIEQRSPAATSGFAFNTRRELFADPRVRQALVLAFDFEWANQNLFYGLYRRIQGFYSGSELSYAGRPVSPRELALLGSAKDTIDAAILDGTYRAPVSDGSGRDRKNLGRALELLGEAGWRLRGNELVNQSGTQFAFTLSIATRDQEKIALHYQRTLKQIGVTMTVRVVDSAQYQRLQQSYDYDMIPAIWYNSLSPGNEQAFYFGGHGRTVEGTRNYPGIADAAVDRLIKALLEASTREDFIAAVRALDRLLVNGHYIVPFYSSGGQWVARRSYVGRPDRLPLQGFDPTTTWFDNG